MRQRREGGGNPGNEILLRQVRVATLKIYSWTWAFQGRQNPIDDDTSNEMLLAMTLLFLKTFYIQIQIDHDQHWVSPIGRRAVISHEIFFHMRSQQKLI